MKKLIAIILIICTMTSLSGCGFAEFLATLGFDTHDYDSEKVIKEFRVDSDIALEMSEMIKILTIDSVNMPEFEGTDEAIELCRDAILNSMYSNNFAKYAGNESLFRTATEMYPHVEFSVLIPADDFENVAYKYFGSKEKITNKSGAVYDYLEGVDAYITVAKPFGTEIEVNVFSLVETENTYRLEFEASLDGEKSPRYLAQLIKRSDDSFYFRYIKKI